MFFFLQEKNNTDQVSFYTPKIISDMITQSVCDELDDSNVLIGKDRTFGRGVVGDGKVTGDIQIPASGSVGKLNVLISVSSEKSGANFSQVLYSHRELYSVAHIISSTLYDIGKIVAFNHEEKRPRLIDSHDKPKKEKSKARAEIPITTPYIIILPFNLYSPNLLDYLRHNKMLTQSLTESLLETI